MMDYTVEFTQPAEIDLIGIYTYIADTLKAPQAASRIYASIKQEITTLSTNPERHQVIDEPPYESQGIRKLFVENYVAFYVADKEKRSVSILRILYNRREWQSILGSDRK